MADLLKEWGFDQDTGIDLPNEKSGRIPSAQWKKDYCEAVAERAPCVDDRWFTGDSVNMAIGQGDVLVTPLQLASAYATVRQRRHPVGAPGAPRDPEGPDRRGASSSVQPEAAGSVDMQPDWRRPSSRASSA